MGKIKILLVDDHTIVREGLRVLIELQEDMSVVGEAANGTEAISLYGDIMPDIVLLDLMLPDMYGVDVIKKIRHRHSDASIAILTTFQGEEDIYRALKAGARGYLLKDTPRTEFFEAIRKIRNGDHYIPVEIAGKLAAYVGKTNLTPREMEILNLISKGYANKTIAEKMCITEGTVKTHVNHILSKLSVKSRTEALKIAHDRGLLRNCG